MIDFTPRMSDNSGMPEISNSEAMEFISGLAGIGHALAEYVMHNPDVFASFYAFVASNSATPEQFTEMMSDTEERETVLADVIMAHDTFKGLYARAEAQRVMDRITEIMSMADSMSDEDKAV